MCVREGDNLQETGVGCGKVKGVALGGQDQAIGERSAAGCASLGVAVGAPCVKVIGEAKAKANGLGAGVAKISPEARDRERGPQGMGQTVGGNRAAKKTVVGAAHPPTGATPKATEAQVIFEVVLSFESGADLPCDKGFTGK